MGAVINLAGQRFGCLSVTSAIPIIRNRRAYWECLCDCGVQTIVGGYHLSHGETRSCGHLRGGRGNHGPRTGHANRTHGLSRSPIYWVWGGMLRRCLNPKCKDYRHYGARGITVCDRWLKFENFFADMGHPPAGLSLDRRDNDSGYSKANCRWATRVQQTNNRRPSALWARSAA